MNKLQLSASVSEEAMARLRFLANNDARSVSNMVEKLINEAYNEHENRQNDNADSDNASSDQ